MSASLHPLLVRQLRRIGLDTSGAAGAPEVPALLLERVSRAYTEADQDRYLLERSQEISSAEMGGLYAELQASQARLASLLSLSSDWVWEQDAELCFTYLSEGISRVGLVPSTLIGMRRKVDELPPVAGSDPAVFEAAIAARQPYRNFTFGMKLYKGRHLYMRISGEPVFEAGVFKGYRGVACDVTQATLAEQRVQQLARFDSLTGLPNRNMFTHELERAVSKAQRSGGAFALLFIDLDRFKTINDTLGHAAGDDLLKVMAIRLSGLLRGADMVARLGGDEFVVLIDGCVEPEALSQVAHRLLGVLSDPLLLSECSVQVNASVGISLYPANGADAATLLKCADTAMYQAKARGKNNFQFFTPEMTRRAAHHFALESDLRQAVERQELRLHFQPKFHARSGALTGVEALVRWQHAQRGLLGPGEFITLAEESGLIVPIGRWVMEEACQQMRRWRDEGFDAVRCAVNLSVRQLASKTLTDDLRMSLASARLEPDALEIEITESLLMADPDRAQLVLQRLHAMALRIAIDDFGTGYSSLAYLKRFPAQTLKIDRSFIGGLPADRDDVAITEAVVAMAHRLGKAVVAEGVETKAQLRFLRDIGCDEVQGYLLGRPVPARELSQRLGPMACKSRRPHRNAATVT